jgi:hypothetical protein
MPSWFEQFETSLTSSRHSWRLFGLSNSSLVSPACAPMRHFSFGLLLPPRVFSRKIFERQIAEQHPSIPLPRLLLSVLVWPQKSNSLFIRCCDSRIAESHFNEQRWTSLKSAALLCKTVMHVAFGGRSTRETDGGGFEPPETILPQIRQTRKQFYLYRATLVLLTLQPFYFKFYFKFRERFGWVQT